MSAGVCSFKGCEKSVHCKALCQGHYRLAKAGKPLRPLRARRVEKLPRSASLEERIWSQVVKAPGDGCWEWQGYTGTWGSGLLYIGYQTYIVHRVIWEQVYGPLEEGQLLRATCGSSSCVRPSHRQLCGAVAVTN